MNPPRPRSGRRRNTSDNERYGDRDERTGGGPAEPKMPHSERRRKHDANGATEWVKQRKAAERKEKGLPEEGGDPPMYGNRPDNGYAHQSYDFGDRRQEPRSMGRDGSPREARWREGRASNIELDSRDLRARFDTNQAYLDAEALRTHAEYAERELEQQAQAESERMEEEFQKRDLKDRFSHDRKGHRRDPQVPYTQASPPPRYRPGPASATHHMPPPQEPYPPGFTTGGRGTPGSARFVPGTSFQEMKLPDCCNWIDKKGPNPYIHCRFATHKYEDLDRGFTH